MTRYHATSNGNIPFTPEEELEADREEQVWTEGATERAMGSLRVQRNQMLTETDWTASTDVTMTAEMTEYRQALRDLPENTEDVFNPVYPDKPK
jgi:hypothetical protein